MAARAENQNTHSQPYPRRRRRKNRRAGMHRPLLTAAIVMLGVAGLVLWNGIRDINSLFSDPGGFPPVANGDTEAPVLSGIHDFTVYEGDALSYMSGISALDESDPNPKITVDSGAVDLSSPGEYEVLYTASDAAGNVSRAAAKVTVLEKQEGFEDLETICAAADAKLAEIIQDGADTRQQVQDIYAWARRNLSYGGHSDRTDWRQTAYTMLTDGRGDCYGYYAVTRLMFERLDIPNIDVQKVRNYPEDSDHFWSLVSVDGGESWYHFDATPRAGEGDDFCLVTDAFLDAYSDTHKGSHNRDQSLYPATPEEAL